MPEIDLVGLGNWAPVDQSYIQSLIEADDHNCVWQDDRPLEVARDNGQTRSTRIRLFSLSSKGSTTVVTRVYRRTGERDVLERRIDEECQDPPDLDRLELALPTLSGKLVLILYDLCKGVVSRRTVRALVEKYETADVFVWTKDWDAEWLGGLDPKRVKLLFLGSEVASLKDPLDGWIYHADTASPEPGRASWEILSSTRPLSTLLVAENGGIVSVDWKRKRWLVSAAATGRSDVQVGWSSSLFAACMRSLLNEGDIVAPACVQTVITQTAEMCSKRDAVPGIIPKHGPPRDGEWAEMANSWKQATHRLGLTGSADDPILELHRGMADLNGYVALMPRRRERLQEIARLVSDFRRMHQIRPLSILLRADPGAGKTSLARALADRFALEFVSADVSQMLDRRELVELLENVASIQTTTSRSVIVFVDEINSESWGTTYSTFLSVLEDGRFAVGRKLYALRPCIWLFAATDVHTEPASKGPDFVSRITFDVDLRYGSLSSKGKSIHDEWLARLEQVYLGALLIRKLHPEVRKVTLGVLAQFYTFDPKSNPGRDIRREVHRLGNIRYGGVSRQNWRGEWRAPSFIENEAFPIPHSERDFKGWVQLV